MTANLHGTTNNETNIESVCLLIVADKFNRQTVA